MPKYSDPLWTTAFLRVYDHYGGGVSSREQRSRARSQRGGVSENRIAGSAVARLFFPDSGSDRDSDETFQISRNLGLEHVEFFCLLDSQPCSEPYMAYYPK